MPELPEVETVRRGLEPHLAGAQLVAVEARRPDLRFALPVNFAGRLIGARIDLLARRGKYILAPLDRGETLVIHLGMTGRFGVESIDGPNVPGVFEHSAPVAAKHAHIRFETDAGAKVTYFDPRRFGYMDLIATSEIADHKWFADMGPEPLGPEFNARALAIAVSRRSQAIKSLLLDQKIVAGLGNIYACEALHRSGISPLTPAGSLTAPRLRHLVAAVRAVLEEAIAAGGSTLRDFADVSGGAGYFQHRFGAYGRAAEPCGTPGCDGRIQRIVQSARSTFFCPGCQR